MVVSKDGKVMNSTDKRTVDGQRIESVVVFDKHEQR
jgi:hypothetical protein